MFAAKSLVGVLGLLMPGAAAPAPLPVLAPVTVVGAGRFTMASINTGRTYRIEIFKPELPPPPGGYPVFYSTDGNMFFDQLADQMRVRQYVDVRPAIIGRAIVAEEAKLKAALAAGSVRPRVLLLVGSEETYPSSAVRAAMPPDEAVRQAQLGRETDDVPEMAVRLKALAGPAGYEVDFHEFAGENHVSVTPASLSRALSFALSTIPPPLRK